MEKETLSRMVLAQITITYQDILDNVAAAGLTINSPSLQNVSIPVRVNVYGGPHRCRITGIQVQSGDTNSVTNLYVPQLITINSSRFDLQGQAYPGFVIANTSSGDPSLAGHREFNIQNIAGNLDIILNIKQLGTTAGATSALTSPYVQFNGSWLQSNFAYLILTIDLQKIEDY
jgi:hypothetical protein